MGCLLYTQRALQPQNKKLFSSMNKIQSLYIPDLVSRTVPESNSVQ